MPPVPRPARSDEIDVLEDLMRESIRAHFPAFYDATQTASATRFIARMDPVLVDDGTYFVHEADGLVVSCGGWSRRAKLFAGPADTDDPDRLIDPGTEPARIRAMFVREGWSRRGLGRAIVEHCAAQAGAAGFGSLALMATLPGVPLYRSCGFVERERAPIVHPDGVELDAVLMDRPIRDRVR